MSTTPTAPPAPPSIRKAAADRVRFEGTIDLQAAAALAIWRERLGLWKPISSRSLLRWIIGGKKGIRLDAARVNGNWCTSIPAVARFLDALDAKQPGTKRT